MIDGSASGLSTFCTPGAPFCEDNDQQPRPGRQPCPSLDVPSSYRLAAFLGRSAKMPRIPLLQPTFRVTSTRDENTTSGDSPPDAVGKPAVARLRDRPWSSGVAAVRSLDHAGPPCGHPASNSLVLDGTTLASGRSTATLAPERRWDSKRRSFVGWRCSVESNPLTPLVVSRKRRRVKRPIPAG